MTHGLLFARLLLLPENAAERLIAHAVRRQARIFAYQHQRFVLNLGLRGADAVRFEWRSLDGGLFPPVSGEVRVHRLGPFGVLVLRATYAPAADGVSKLLQGALGKRPARAALRGAGLAMTVLVKAVAGERTVYGVSR